MKITEYLNVEHGVFLTQLKYVEQLLDRGAPSATLAAVVQAIARAVATHRDVEERYLYPAIDQACKPGDSPIEAMEKEHGEIERALQQIESGTFDKGVVRTFVGVLQDHIGKEIKMIFPLAEERISAAELVEMKRLAVKHVHDRAGVKLSR